MSLSVLPPLVGSALAWLKGARAPIGWRWPQLLRQTNQLRSTLREFYPAALEAFDDLASGDALAVLAVAPTPALGRGLSRSKIAAALRRGGRQRRIEGGNRDLQGGLQAAGGGRRVEDSRFVAIAMMEILEDLRVARLRQVEIGDKVL